MKNKDRGQKTEDSGSQGANFTAALAGSQLYGWTGTCRGEEAGHRIWEFREVVSSSANWPREVGDSVLVKTEKMEVGPQTNIRIHIAGYYGAEVTSFRAFKM